MLRCSHQDHRRPSVLVLESYNKCGVYLSGREVLFHRRKSTFVGSSDMMIDGGGDRLCRSRGWHDCMPASDDVKMVPRIVLWDYCRLDTVE